MPNTPIKSKVEEISAILRDEILRGQYRVGERLPSERDLAVRFETSRGGIREALKKLEQLGIATITPGGVRVVAVEEASLSILGPLVDLQETPDPELVGHLLEVLGALVSMAARNAIENASDVQLQEMQSIVNTLIENAEDSEQQHNGWRDLSTLFAVISNNLVLRLILNGLKTQFVDRLNSRPQVPLEFDPKQRMETLKLLSNGIKTRDAKCVSSTILAHFDYTNLTIQNVINSMAARSLAQ